MEASLKKLRIRFTLSMGLLSGILLFVLCGVLCISIFASSELTSRAVLDAMLEHPADEVVDEMGRPCFVFVSSPAGVTVPAAYTDRINIYGDSAEDILRAAVETGNGKFAEGGFYFRVVSADITDNSTMYAVIDRTSDRQNLLTVATLVVLIYVTALIVAVLFFYLYSSYALAPVGDSMKKQRDLIANASHELKTPLTVITTNAELLQQPGVDEQARERLSGNVLGTARHMRTLLEQMLELAKGDHPSSQAAYQPVDFGEVVSHEALAYEAVFFEEGLELESRGETSVSVLGDPVELRQVVDILLDNARKYSNPGGKTVMTLRQEGRRKCLLAVSNPGPEIAPQDLPHLFQRFYRSDRARTRSGSFGLGLAIAQSMVQRHRGRIWAQSRQGVNTFVGRAKGLKGEELKHQVTDVMALTKIEHVAHRRIGDLSKGYRQRVGIAQALLGNPKVIILDEPTVGLDPIQIIEIRDLIRELGRTHTVIFSSHILSEVQAICDRILIIAHGKLVAFDCPENLERDLLTQNQITLTTQAGPDEVQEVLDRLDHLSDITFQAKEGGYTQTHFHTSHPKPYEITRQLFWAFAESNVPLLEMTLKKASLEDVFLELTETAPAQEDEAEEMDEEVEEA